LEVPLRLYQLNQLFPAWADLSKPPLACNAATMLMCNRRRLSATLWAAAGWLLGLQLLQLLLESASAVFHESTV